MLCLDIFATLLATVLASVNTNIANGTCYYMPQSTSPSVFIPCGNVAAGNVPCCGVGDNCLFDCACWNPGTGDTYRVGCTDPKYQDSSCPNKGNFSDHVWTGLITYINNPREWIACNNTATTLTHGKIDECPTGPPVFTDAPVLESSARLPSATGMSISWFAGYSQITAAAATATSSTAAATFSTEATSVSPSSSQTNALSTTSASEASPLSSTSNGTPPSTLSASSTLSTAAKAGIGTGAFFAIVGLSALIWLLALYLRHRRGANEPIPPIEDQIRRRSIYTESSPEKSALNTNTNTDDLRSPAWSGHKSELSADGIGVISPVSANRESDLGVSGGMRSSRISEVGTNTNMNLSPQRYYQLPQREQELNSVHELPMSTSPRPGFYEMPG